MLKKALVFVACSLMLFSCQRDKKEILIGRWHAVYVENPQMEALLAQGQMFIDTVGKNTDAATNMQTYGLTNIDSMRRVLQAQLDSVKLMQTQTIKSTWFTFRKNGTAVLNFSGFSDSTKWYFDDRGNLMLNEMKEKGSSAVKLQVVALEDTVLKLQLTENGMSSSVTFHPEAK